MARGPLNLRTFEPIYYGLMTPLIWAAYAFLRAVPDRALPKIGQVIGRIILFGRKRRVMRNMRMMLRDECLEGPGWDGLWRMHLAHLGMAVAEIMHYLTAPLDELRQRAALEKGGALGSALRQGRGAVVLINHFENPGAVPAALALAGHRVTVATNVIPVPYLEKALDRALGRLNVSRVTADDNVASAGRRALRANGLFAAAIDYSSTRSHTGWVPCVGAELEVSIAPAMIALICGSPIFLALVKRVGESRYVVSLRPIMVPAEGSRHERALAITREAMADVAECIRREPTRWWRWDFPRLRPMAEAAQALE